MLYSFKCQPRLSTHTRDLSALLRRRSQGPRRKHTKKQKKPPMVVTINVNGLDTVKWKKIKISLNADTNVIALQETHCDVQRTRDIEIH